MAVAPDGVETDDDDEPKGLERKRLMPSPLVVLVSPAFLPFPLVVLVSPTLLPFPFVATLRDLVSFSVSFLAFCAFLDFLPLILPRVSFR